MPRLRAELTTPEVGTSRSRAAVAVRAFGRSHYQRFVVRWWQLRTPPRLRQPGSCGPSLRLEGQPKDERVQQRGGLDPQLRVSSHLAAFAEVLEHRGGAPVVVDRVLFPDGLAPDRVRRPVARARESQTIAPVFFATPERSADAPWPKHGTACGAARWASTPPHSLPVGLLSMATMSDLWAHGLSPYASAV